MKIEVVEISVTELQQALREYVGRHAGSQPSVVLVDNGYGKTVLTVPLAEGATISGEAFRRATEMQS